jgi:hypothetical protein
VQELILPYVQKLVMRRLDLSQAGPEAMSLILGLQTFVNEVPSQMNQLLSDLSTGRFMVSARGEALDELATAGRVHSVRTVLAILGGALLIGAAITAAPFSTEWAPYGVPVLPVLFLLALGAALTGLTVTFLFPKGLRKIRLSRFLFWRRSPRS